MTPRNRDLHPIVEGPSRFSRLSSIGEESQCCGVRRRDPITRDAALPSSGKKET